jgi:hypothetical protein
MQDKTVRTGPHTLEQGHRYSQACLVDPHQAPGRAPPPRSGDVQPCNRQQAVRLRRRRRQGRGYRSGYALVRPLTQSV